MKYNTNQFKQNQNKLSKNGYLRINNFLENELAERIYSCLLTEVNWGLAYRIDGKAVTKLNISDIQGLDSQTRDKLKLQQKEEFQFIYNTYMIVTSYLEQRDPGHYLYHLLELINSPKSIQYFSELTTQSVKKLNAQATRYMPGHYLKQHNDENSEEGRMYAYVLGFTKDWNPDWGGLLNILDESGNIVNTMIPEFNTLSIFKVPKNHFVSYVTPYAESERLGITGWLLNK